MRWNVLYPLGLLLIPFCIDPFSDEVDWGIFDFVVMGILLVLVGKGMDTVLKKNKTFNTKILTVSLLAILFFLIWAELAVGIFGSPFAGN